MDEWDFLGVLFVHFPVPLLWDKARRMMEDMIRRIGENEISPFTINLAFSAEHTRLFNNLPAEQKQKIFEEAWNERMEHLRKRGIIVKDRPPPLIYTQPKPKPRPPVPADWTF